MINISKISNLFHTVRFLKPIQVYSRIVLYVKSFIPINTGINQSVLIHTQNLKFAKSITSLNSNCKNTFEFLNLKKDFFEQIDWNYYEFGLLWTYNLNYFEFLNQEGITSQDGEKLINDFISDLPNRIVGFEPYPLSLRCINWIKFFISHNISNSNFDSILFKQLNLLTHKLEYHLLGNHLLENGFALLFGAYYFNDEKLYKKAKKILIHQLDEQILPDGGHFELSSMYHCTILLRMLDCYNLVSNNDLFSKELKQLLFEKSKLMLSWIKTVTFKNGNIPLMNDAALNIAPKPDQLEDYASHLGLYIEKEIKLKESGYRKLFNTKYELLVDVGEIGPYYQPGHAHADTFSFELYVNGRAVIIDTGTSTYEVNDTRFYERSTSAHNTVVVDNLNSSQVWGGHRVAKRAHVEIIIDSVNNVCAIHDGFKKIGVLHKRCFILKDESLEILDIINYNGIAFLHFSSNEKIKIVDNIVYGIDYTITFDGAVDISILNTKHATEFNKELLNITLCVAFHNRLITLFN